MFRLIPLFAALVVGETAIAGDSPIQGEILGGFATFVHRDHPGNRIGYRFHEHTPLLFGEIPRETTEAGRVGPSVEERIAQFVRRPGVLEYRKRVTEADWSPQTWTFHLSPVADGIEMLLVVETSEVGLPDFHGIQQCFRLGGETNQEWRQKYARTPAFSEFDLWSRATDESGKVSLTSVWVDGAPRPVPACRESVGYRTGYGESLDTRRSRGRLDWLTHVGSYDARILGTADSGLISRTSLDGKWSCGLYWERSTHLTNHHPADCVHAIVNIGGIPPHSKRVLRGKIYWMPGSGNDLAEHWRRDFPSPE
ncbi:MAG: hypothetical protein HUU16_00715 [Candidatus Omnitrophica bacterium]|nr:hypothetical protein [Candidatus Omnitrophota bacterium]